MTDTGSEQPDGKTEATEALQTLHSLTFCDLFFLACGCPWVEHPNGLGAGYDTSMCVTIGNLRSAWKELRRREPHGGEEFEYCMSRAAEAGQRKDWVSAAGWLELARRIVEAPQSWLRSLNA